MPHHKSCKKRMAISKKQNIRNKAAKSQMKTAIKKVASATTKDDAQEALKTAYSVIDKSAMKGVIHKNNAANKKSRLSALMLKKA